MDKAVAYKKHGIIYFQRKNIPRKYFVMKKMGVRKNTFAGNLVSRMYDYYFKDELNFQKEYRRYYRKEFDSICMFIEEHYNMEHDVAKELSKGNYSIKNCSSQSIERNVETLNYDESFKNAFSKAIGGLRDEDPDGIYYE